MKKEELSQAIFGRQVSEEELSYHIFGRPVHPGMTFEQTFADFDLMHKTDPTQLSGCPECLEAIGRIEYADMAWAQHINALGPYCPWPKPDNGDYDLLEGETLVEARSLSFEEWEEERQQQQVAEEWEEDENGNRTGETSYPSLKTMAGNLVKSGAQAVSNRPVDKETYNKRLDVCRNCPAFDPAQKRCTECGCYMPAKAHIGGDPDALCPLKKWSDL